MVIPANNTHNAQYFDQPRDTTKSQAIHRNKSVLQSNLNAHPELRMPTPVPLICAWPDDMEQQMCQHQQGYVKHGLDFSPDPLKAEHWSLYAFLAIKADPGPFEPKTLQKAREVVVGSNGTLQLEMNTTHLLKMTPGS